MGVVVHVGTEPSLARALVGRAGENGEGSGMKRCHGRWCCTDVLRDAMRGAV